VYHWFETIGVIIIAFFGIYLGRFFSRLKKPYWLIGCYIPAVILAVLIAARLQRSINFVPPLSFVLWGRNQYIFLSLAVTIGLTTPLSRLPRRAEKAIVCLVMAVVVAIFTILPFLGPSLMRNRLLTLGTVVDTDGVCLQSYKYSCGPAAAVTALRQLGFRASEGEIAALAYTSPVIGTLPSCLYSALEKRYRPHGLKLSYRFFDSVSQLKNSGVTLAIINTGFLNDHCVTILDVSDDKVVIADPAIGRISMSHARFAEIWRFYGIVLEKNTTPKT